MENLEASRKLLTLGKLFVKELNLEPGVDTFSRWVAHYLAEKITLVEQSTGKEKKIAEKECFEVIIKLWNNRYAFPNGRRPLENFEPIIELLRNLNPEREKTFFFDPFEYFSNKHHQDSSINLTTIENCINNIKEIDKIARIWIEYILNKTIGLAQTDSTKEWIESNVITTNIAEIGIIETLMNNKFDYKDNESYSSGIKIEKLKERISQLKKFKKFNNVILKAYEEELEGSE